MEFTTGTAERVTALDMIEDNAKPGSTVGGDKNYDTADFVAGCRERNCTLAFRPLKSQSKKSCEVHGKPSITAFSQ
jgi:hypothetical protein